MDPADLISYGMIGLVDAMERFEPRREIRFETFAMQRIRGAIIDGLRPGLGAALGALPRPPHRGGELEARARARPAPTDAELAGLKMSQVDDLQEALLQISNSSILALEELWMAPDASGDKVSLLDTTRTRELRIPRPRLDTNEVRTASPRRSNSRAGDARRRSLLPGEPDLEGDREVLGVTESWVSQVYLKAALRGSAPA